MTQILKPCPFCGGAAILVRQGTVRQSHQIECEDCGCFVESGEVDWNSGNKWNTREPNIPSVHKKLMIRGANAIGEATDWNWFDEETPVPDDIIDEICLTARLLRNEGNNYE